MFWIDFNISCLILHFKIAIFSKFTNISCQKTYFKFRLLHAKVYSTKLNSEKNVKAKN